MLVCLCIGNTNWLAAVECESATYSMALRVWPKDGLSAIQAQNRLRASILDALHDYIDNKAYIKSPQNIVDIGCSVGISTFYLAQSFPTAIKILGIDLSPHFLAIALKTQTEALSSTTTTTSVSTSVVASTDSNTSNILSKDNNIARIQWKHALAEDTKLPSNSIDIITTQFTFHELPQVETKLIIAEMYRICKPGGVIAITDNDPKSPIIQNLSPGI